MNSTLAFLFLRLAVGASMLGHGLVRLPRLHGFSAWMTGAFKDSMMPQALVVPFSYALPVLEFAIGLLLVSGLLTRQALIAGNLVMLMLIFGSCLIEEWNAIPSQLIHVLIFSGLLSYLSLNSYAIDNLLKR